MQTTGNIMHFCSEGLKISALHPLTAEPVLSLNQRVTSVAVTTTGHHTVALLGTSTGTMKKVSFRRVLTETSLYLIFHSG